MIKNDYGLGTTLDLPFADAIAAITNALKTEGFGILTEINIQETLKKKLDVNFRRYVILGACNPPLAYQALQTELDIGLLLPCNVIVYEMDGGKTAVSIADPQVMVAITGTPALQGMADEARAKLTRALESLS
ncbi:MAG: DUF302 domain-containing protein [Chloroflexota bacterium]